MQAIGDGRLMLFVWVVCLVVFKYGVLAFVLSRLCRDKGQREGLKSIVTGAILLGMGLGKKSLKQDKINTAEFTLIA